MRRTVPAMAGVPPDVLVGAGAGVLAFMVGLLAVAVARRTRRRDTTEDGPAASEVSADASTSPSAASASPVPVPAGGGLEGRRDTVFYTGYGSADDTQPTDTAPASWDEVTARSASDDQDAFTRDRPESALHGAELRRLLSVLFDDNPDEVLTAARELQACRTRLDRLSDAVRKESAVLSDLLNRLARAGLHDDQLARLASLPVEEVRELLRAPGAAGG